MLKPDMYQKDVFHINYDILKEKGIKIVLFDLDNTLIKKGEVVFHQDIKKLLDSLKNDFSIFVVSNSLDSKKIKTIKKDYHIKIVQASMKPTSRGYKKIQILKYHKPSEICMIGDQLLTDILGAKHKGYYSILIDFASADTAKITFINRLFEKFFFKHNKIKRGEYYE